MRVIFGMKVPHDYEAIEVDIEARTARIRGRGYEYTFDGSKWSKKTR